MRLHPLHGARILSNIQSDRVVSVLPGVKYHHERWDGKGYPEGLKGEEIPLLGRVLGVADFLDALTSDRTYRTGLPLEEALQMVKDLEGQRSIRRWSRPPWSCTRGVSSRCRRRRIRA